MIHNYSKFINGEIFTKNDILKILKDNKIECQIIDIVYYQYKKIYIKINEDGIVSILKLCLHKHSIELAKNENYGYSFFNNDHNSKFNLPNYKQVNVNENYALSKINFIKGNRGSYFEFAKFYKNNFSRKSRSVSIEDYIFSTYKRFKIEDYMNTEAEKFSNITKMILNKYKSAFITLDTSHGDFISFNSIKTNEKYYMFDLEFFRKDASFLYDYFHWHISPLIFKSTKYKQQSFFLKIFPLFIKFLYFIFKKKYKKAIIDNENSFKIHLILFLLERHALSLIERHALSKFKKLDNDELITLIDKNLLSDNSNLYMNLIIKIL